MNRRLLKKTFRYVLRRYPIVFAVMTVTGFVLVKMMGHPVLSIGLVLFGSIAGPALGGMFYYQTQLKKERLEKASSADRLRQVSELFQKGLLSEKEYQRIRRAISQEEAKEETGMEENQDKIRAGKDSSMKIHPWLAIMVALSWPMIGFFLCMIVKAIFGIELPKFVRSIVNLLVGCFGVFYLFPKIYRAPFGPIPVKEYLKRIGFYLPHGAWRHILLGMILAGGTLSGMLAASLLAGRYSVDWNTVHLSHVVFSLNPGIFEEIFYRGIIMMLLLTLTGSLKKALVWQIVIFGLAHIKGFDLLTFADVVSVMIIAIAFTYAAYKTRALLAGMIFHFLHDVFLFFVQVPEGIYRGLRENVVFYGILWLMVAGCCFIIRFATERLNVRGENELYSLK